MKSFREAGILPGGVVDRDAVKSLFDEGGQIFVENGEYIFEQPIFSAKHLKLVGETKKGVVLRTAHRGDFLTAVGGFLQVENLTLLTDNGIGKAGIVADFPSNGLTFRDMEIRGFKFGMVLDQAICVRVDSCRFSKIAMDGVGIIIDNNAIPDAGNSLIHNCNFGGPPTARSAILQRNSGGLHIMNNSFLGFRNGYELRLKGNTSVLMASNNSFEAQAEHCFRLEVRKEFEGSGFTMVNISGNELTGSGKSLVSISDILGIKVNDNICNLEPNTLGFEFIDCKKGVCKRNLMYSSKGGQFDEFESVNSQVKIDNDVYQ